MATLTKMGSYPDIQLPLRPEIRREFSIPGSIPVLGQSRKCRRRRCWKVCRGFKEEEGGGAEIEEREKDIRNLKLVLKVKGNVREIGSSIKSGIVRLCKFPSGDENRDALAELEKVLFSVYFLLFLEFLISTP